MNQAEPVTPLATPPMMTDDEIKTLARDLAMEKVFTSNHLPDTDARLLGNIFLPLGLGGLSGYDVTQIGMLYEYYDRAGPRAINGYPSFFSMRIVHRDQMRPIFEKYQAIRTALEAV